MIDNFIAALLVVGFLALWIITWVSISYLAGRVSGWQKLALMYPDTAKGQVGEKKRWLYIRFGSSRYNGAVVFEALSVGLRIKTIWPFRFGQPTMVVPWSEIAEPEKMNTNAWNYMYTHQFTIQGAKHPVSCSAEHAEWLSCKKKEFSF